MMKHTIFVYGTLKKDDFNHYLLENDKFLGYGITEKPYLLVCDTLLYLFKKSNHEFSNNIKGELYDISDDTLKRLDNLEYHPYFYKRESIFVKNISTNEYVYSWCYFINDKSAVSKSYYIIKSGEYKKY
jgi:gamma-glutamylaminecyclotransferase